VSKFKGAYQHFYDDNFSEYQLMTHYVFLTYEITFNDNFSEYQFTTHSVFLAYEITFNGELSSLPVE
jgi:colanic acid biosynthesis protein WcaH